MTICTCFKWCANPGSSSGADRSEYVFVHVYTMHFHIVSHINLSLVKHYYQRLNIVLIPLLLSEQPGPFESWTPWDHWRSAGVFVTSMVQIFSPVRLFVEHIPHTDARWIEIWRINTPNCCCAPQTWFLNHWSLVTGTLILPKEAME